MGDVDCSDVAGEIAAKPRLSLSGDDEQDALLLHVPFAVFVSLDSLVQ